MYFIWFMNYLIKKVSLFQESPLPKRRMVQSDESSSEAQCLGNLSFLDKFRLRFFDKLIIIL